MLLVMVFVGISLFVLGGALTWTSTNAQLTRRNNHYFNSVAAAEAAIGLAILVIFYRNRGSIAVEDVNLMKG